MPDLSDDARRAMKFWGEIETAASERMTTADLWASLHDAAAELGLDSPGVTLRGVNELRSLATTIHASGRRFERAHDNVSLEGKYVAEAPWSRDLAQRDALGMYQVRFQHTTLGPDGPTTDWRTSVFYGKLPGTVGELRAALAEDAEQMANKYGVSHADFSSVQIMSI